MANDPPYTFEPRGRCVLPDVPGLHDDAPPPPGFNKEYLVRRFALLLEGLKCRDPNDPEADLEARVEAASAIMWDLARLKLIFERPLSRKQKIVYAKVTDHWTHFQKLGVAIPRTELVPIIQALEARGYIDLKRDTAKRSNGGKPTEMIFVRKARVTLPTTQPDIIPRKARRNRPNE